MPKLIRWRDGVAAWGEDPFTAVDDDQLIPRGDVTVSLARFQRERAGLLAQGRSIGVRLAADEAPEVLVVDLPRLAMVALTFPKFRDGRAFSAARVLRERLAFAGELRAIGDVQVELAGPYVRCGFDTFEPADGSTPDQWTHAAHRFRHVYQRAADRREPVSVLREEA